MLSGRKLFIGLAVVALATAPAYGHTLFDGQSDSPDKGWRINAWGKRDDGSKGRAEITVVDGPGGGKAVQASIGDSPGCSVIRPVTDRGPWREQSFGAVELVYRGDGSPGQVSFHLDGTAGDGKTRARASFVLSLHRQTWTTVVLRPAPAPRGKPRLKLSAVSSMYFGCYGTFSLAVASARLLTHEELGKIEAAKSPEQRAWEAAVRPNLRRLPGFEYVADTPGLPRVLIIGDSISIHYTHFVRQFLEGKANVHRIPTNGGPTDRGLQHLDTWLGNGNWQVIYFNWGLHDSKYDKWDRKTGKRYSTPEAYAQNLGELVVRLKATGARLIWATTTPVPEGARTHDVGDSARFNAAAAPIMEKHGIAVSDLYSLVKPDLAAHIKPANIHFTHGGSRLLARKAAEDILAQLSRR